MEALTSLEPSGTGPRRRRIDRPAGRRSARAVEQMGIRELLLTTLQQISWLWSEISAAELLAADTWGWS